MDESVKAHDVQSTFMTVDLRSLSHRKRRSLQQLTDEDSRQVNLERPKPECIRCRMYKKRVNLNISHPSFHITQSMNELKQEEQTSLYSKDKH